ncbi:MAG: GIY-YIG nuclease family protein, partial [Rickettsiaceae bacterium]|nr:GIY-YIG nuclease family protein [Rickettsiaceae bacterium]
MTQYQKKLSNNILYGKELIKSRLEELPGQPGVYRMLDIDKKIIYIGKAKNLKNRLKQ